MLKNFSFNKDKEQYLENKTTGCETHSNDSKNLESPIDYTNNTTLKLQEENLDIIKKWMETAEVNIYKEILTEEKNITVPIKREELVIEKKILDEKNLNKKDEHIENIRIAISEEHIEVVKHLVILEDISVYKRQFQEIKQVEGSVKKEKAHIESTGNAIVIDEENKEEL